MSDLHFFTEPNKMAPQLQEQAFGPISDPSVSKFNVSSTHTLSSKAKIFAPFDAYVTAQYDNNGDISLIFSPVKQLKVKPCHITLFIIKGVNKNSIIQSGLVIEDSNSEANDLTKKINKSQQLINQELGTTDRAPESLFGLDLTSVADTTCITHLFEGDFDNLRRIRVKKGDHVGYAEGQISVEVYSERIGSVCELSRARTFDLPHTTTKLPDTPTDLEIVDYRSRKNEVLDYIDVVAMYGNYCNEGVDVDGASNKKEATLYNDVISKFHNKDRVYVDLRNDDGLSFNIDNTYNDEIKFRYGETEPEISFNYNDDAPILIFGEGNPFPDSAKANHHLILDVSKGDNNEPVSVLHSGFPYKSEADLDTIAQPLSNYEKFIPMDVQDATSTSRMELLVPSNGSNKPYASYSRVSYNKGHDYYKVPDIDEDPGKEKTHYLDNVLRIFDMDVTLKGDNSSVEPNELYIKNYEGHELYLDATRNFLGSLLSTTGIAKDHNFVHFYAAPLGRAMFEEANMGGFLSVPSYYTDKHESFWDFIVNETPNAEGYVRKSVIKTDTTDYYYLSLDKASGTEYSLRSPRYDELISVSFSHAWLNDLTSLKGSSGFSNKLPVKLGFKYDSGGKDQNEVDYEIYELVLIGSEEVGDTLQTKRVSSGKKVVTLGTGNKLFFPLLNVETEILPGRQVQNNVKEAYLTSKLLRDDRDLFEIANRKTLQANLPNVIFHGDYIEKIALALKIVLPEVALTDEDRTNLFNDLNSEFKPRAKNADGTDKTEIVNGFVQPVFEEIKVYNDLMDKYVRIYQTIKGLPVDGNMGPNTLRMLDKDLTDIYFYDTFKEKTIHNKSKHVPAGIYSIAYQASGASLKDEPALGATEIKHLNQGDKVLVYSFTEGQASLDTAWFYVELVDAGLTQADLETDKDGFKHPKPGKTDFATGYIHGAELWHKSEMPESDARLYTIQAGDKDNLTKIVTDHYLNNEVPAHDDAPTIDPANNLRFYMNALMYLNNPEGKSTKTRYNLNTFANPNSGKAEFDLAETNIPAAIYSDGIDASNKSFFDYFKNAYKNPEGVFPLFTKAQRTIDNFFNNQKPAGTYVFDWIGAKVIDGKQIWLPSVAFLQGLKNIVNSGDPTDEMKKALYDPIVGLLNEYWPIGFGVSINSGFGATFGIPLGIDAELEMDFYRVNEDTFALKKRGTLIGGFDAGVGVGFFVGSGKRKRTGKNKDKEWGLGTQLAGDVQAGFKLAVTSEYEFNFKEDYSLLNLINNVMGDASITSILRPHKLAMDFVKSFFSYNLDEHEYLKKFKIDGGFRAAANIGAFAGVRFGAEDDGGFWTQGSQTKNTHTKGESVRWYHALALLSAGITGGLETGLAAGIELSYPKGFVEEAYGFKMPVETIIKLEFNGYFLPSATLDLPIIGNVLAPIQAAIPSPDIGGGFVFKYTYKDTDFDANGTTPAFVYEGFYVFQKSGDLDFYNGPASKKEIFFKKDVINWTNITLAQVKDAMQHLTIEQRVGAPYVSKSNINALRYADLLKLQERFKVLASTDGKLRKGLIGSAYFTNKLKIPGANFITFVEGVWDDWLTNGGVQTKQAVGALLSYISIDEEPKKFPPLVVELFDDSELETSNLRISVGIGAAMGAHVAVGAKARLQLNSKIEATFLFDNTQEIAEFFQENKDNIAKFILGKKKQFLDTIFAN